MVIGMFFLYLKVLFFLCLKVLFFFYHNLALDSVIIILLSILIFQCLVDKCPLIVDTKDYEKNIGLSFSLSEKFKIKSFSVDYFVSENSRSSLLEWTLNFGYMK